MAKQAKRLIVGISGASGAVYGIRLLEVLRENPGIETHLIMTEAAKTVISLESELDPGQIALMADHSYSDADISAAPASGTFQSMGMVVIPCSMKTLSALARSYSSGLLRRAGDVTLKERRPLVLAVRETPLHLGHLRLMADVTETGAIVAPPVPAFYERPTTIGQLIDHSLGKILDLLDIEHELFKRWDNVRITRPPE
ncbi:UbiX family flavin prenyltransferase [Thermodesulfobacteriota bacterium]